MRKAQKFWLELGDTVMQGWSKRRLIEITEKIGSGATPRGGQEAYKETGISLFRSLNVYDGVFKEKNLAFIDDDQANRLSNVVVREGDVLLNITGASIARCCAAPLELLPARVNQHVMIVRPKPDCIDTNFLAYLLVSKQYKDALLNTGEKAGSTRQALTKTQIENFEVTIPKLPEQKRIVLIVDQAFEGIDRAIANTQKNLTNARELFESYLNAIFTQKGDGWIEKKLGDAELLQIIDGDRGKNYPKESDFLVEGHCLFLNTKNVRPNGFNFDTTIFITQEKDDILRKGKLKRRDVILTTRGTIGNIAIYDDSVEFDHIRINSGMLIFRPNESIIRSEYLFEVLRSSIVKSQIEKFTSGAAQPQLPIKTLVNFTLPVPTLEDQSQIVSSLHGLSAETQRLEAIYRQKLAALNELKQSILQKAFTGELTADTTNQATKTAKEVIAA